LGFQEYFVRERCQPSVTGFEFNHVEKSTPADGVLEALRAADGIIICPSNPWVSIGPILAVPGIRDVLLKKPVIAVSPLIQGQALKGPAAKMYQELGFTPDALSVAKHYQSLLAGFVMDTLDTGLCEPVSELGIEAYACQTIMRNTDDRIALAEEVVSFLSRLIRRPA
jgi:LPPG:FO 2-phospho-L-lactate transferase